MAKPLRAPTTEEQSILEGLQVKLLTQRPDQARWNRLVRQHHYLKNARLVGEQLRYAVSDAQGNWLALLGWSAAALHLKARDQSIEWSRRQRQGRLHLVAQNSRFVILADRGALPNLATRALSRCLRRLCADWQARYGHPIVLVESFVDRQLFRATAYKAGGWQALGYSSGFKRVAEDFYQEHQRPKELWVKALHPRAWDWLRAPELPSHLARYEKALPPDCAVPLEQQRSLFERFEAVSDWRQRIGKRHRLSTVLSLVALACLSGVGQGYRAVARFAQRLNKYQRRAVGCWINPDTAQSHVPSEGVFQRVLQQVSRTEVEQIALQWQNDLLGPLPAEEAVVFDGKAVRAAKQTVVHAVAQPSQRLLGLEPVAPGSNEIPAAQKLLERVELEGRLVQCDALHTQHRTAAQLLYESGADYSLVLRDNQPTLLATAQQLLPTDLPPSGGRAPATGRTPGVPGVGGQEH